MASDSASMSTTKTLLTSIGSAVTTTVVVRSIYKDLLPDEFTDYIYDQLRHILNRFSRQITMVINEYNGLAANEIYEAAVVYLASKASSNRRFNISKPHNENSISVAVDRNGQVDDQFDGAKIKWVWVSQETYTRSYSNDHQNQRSEKRSFELHFHEKHQKKVLESYLPYVLKQAQTAKNMAKSLQIFTVDKDNLEYGIRPDGWIPVNLDHPSSFETLAMDSDLKKTIVNDLDRFVSRREFYRNVGKAWKRGYLLYGPPGTGKSSLIAAMANYLKFNVYDLDLTAIENDYLLRRLLLSTANRSILVVEDIDCTIQLHDRGGHEETTSEENEKEKKSKVTLSGFLNFVDGLWSSCGDERIIIFTTNHKEKLDPALLRPGRMDMHICMSYCTPSGFRTLARNYLHIDDHKLFANIDELIKSIEVTPAELAEQLLKCERDVDVALSGILSFLKEKMEKGEANTTMEETKFPTKQGLVIEEDNQNIEDNDENNNEIKASY